MFYNLEPTMQILIHREKYIYHKPGYLTRFTFHSKVIIWSFVLFICSLRYGEHNSAPERMVKPPLYFRNFRHPHLKCDMRDYMRQWQRREAFEGTKESQESISLWTAMDRITETVTTIKIVFTKSGTCLWVFAIVLKHFILKLCQRKQCSFAQLLCF